MTNQQKLKLRLIELELKERELYQKRPDLWLVHRFGAKLSDVKWQLHDPEKYATHEWDGTREPIWEIFKSLSNQEWVGVEAATGVGKTYIAPLVIFWFLDCFDRALVVTTAPKKSQLKSVLWKEIEKRFGDFKKIHPRSEIYAEPKIQVIADDKDFADWKLIGEVAGVEAGAEVATKMAGQHAPNMLFVLEEASGISQPIYNAVVNTCTASNNLIFAIGNPNSTDDVLHRHCTMGGVKHIRISGFDHPNLVTGQEIIQGAVSASSIERRLKEYGEKSTLFGSRVRGICPEQSTEALIRAEWIDDCFENGADFEIDEERLNSAGVDVANSKDGDKGAVSYFNGHQLLHLEEFPCPNANHLAYNLVYDESELLEKGFSVYHIPTLEAYDIVENIGVDAVGVGVGTVNTFIDEGYDVTALQGGALKKAIPHDNGYDDPYDDNKKKKPKPLYSFPSLRSQMFVQLKTDFQNRQIDLSHLPKATFLALKKELVSMTYSTKTGQTKVEAKESIKKRLGKSPNLADAVAYGNWMSHGHYMADDEDVFVGACGGLD